MQHRLFPSLPLLCALTLAIAGCQGPVAPNTPAAVAVADATVQIDLGSLLGDQRKVSTSLPAAPEPTALRVRVHTPESVSPTEQIFSSFGPTVSLTVPGGKNRLIELEALVRDGANYRVSRRIAIVAALASGGSISLQPNYGTTAAADTLAVVFARMRDASTSNVQRNKLKGFLTSVDFAGWLWQQVQDRTGYVAGFNQYKYYNPTLFPSAALGAHLAGFLLEAETVDAELTGFESPWLYPQSGSVEVRLGGVNTAQGAETTFVQILAPERQTFITENGVVHLTDVPPGTWAVYAKQGSRVAWGTVTVTPDETALAELHFSGSMPLDYWIFRDAPAKNWTFSPVPTFDGGVIFWSPMTPVPLVITKPGTVDVTGYRFLSFTAQSNHNTEFEVELQDAAGNTLGQQPCSAGGEMWPMPNVLDLADTDLISAADRPKLARIVVKFVASESASDLWLDDLRFTQVGPEFPL